MVWWLDPVRPYFGFNRGMVKPFDPRAKRVLTLIPIKYKEKILMLTPCLADNDLWGAMGYNCSRNLQWHSSFNCLGEFLLVESDRSNDGKCTDFLGGYVPFWTSLFLRSELFSFWYSVELWSKEVGWEDAEEERLYSLFKQICQQDGVYTRVPDAFYPMMRIFNRYKGLLNMENLGENPDRLALLWYLIKEDSFMADLLRAPVKEVPKFRRGLVLFGELNYSMWNLCDFDLAPFCFPNGKAIADKLDAFIKSDAVVWTLFKQVFFKGLQAGIPFLDNIRLNFRSNAFNSHRIIDLIQQNAKTINLEIEIGWNIITTELAQYPLTSKQLLWQLLYICYLKITEEEEKILPRVSEKEVEEVRKRAEEENWYYFDPKLLLYKYMGFKAPFYSSHEDLIELVTPKFKGKTVSWSIVEEFLFIPEEVFAPNAPVAPSMYLLALLTHFGHEVRNQSIKMLARKLRKMPEVAIPEPFNF